jgi:hypothetical protein
MPNQESIRPLYRPLPDGTIPLYEGELDIEAGDTVLRVNGRVELRLEPRVDLNLWVPGPASTNLFFTDDPQQPDRTAVVPEGSDLRPPGGERPDHHGSHGTFLISPVVAGQPEAATRLLFHFGGALDFGPVSRSLLSDRQQWQISFELPGWDLTLVPGNREIDGFCALIQAEPRSGEASFSDIEALDRRLFFLLSFIANREVAAGAVAGLDSDGEIVWTYWAPPRANPKRAPIRWCPEPLTAEALPMLASGLTRWDSDEAMIEIIDRAIGYSLAANDDALLDVKVPIACSGLELLSWAVLQREGVMRTGDERRKLGPDGMLRLLLEWVGLPVDVPGEMNELEQRRQDRCEKVSGGPEVLFNVRNGLVHPPKRLKDPEWPEPEEVFQAWQLATWYLELGLLRTLEYEGDYWSRLRLGRSAHDVEPVPWSKDPPQENSIGSADRSAFDRR